MRKTSFGLVLAVVYKGGEYTTPVVNPSMWSMGYRVNTTAMVEDYLRKYIIDWK